MYLGGLLFLAGIAVLIASVSEALLLYGVGIVLSVNLFIFGYEEPTLRRKFGDEYLNYCLNVRRWLPRAVPWTPEGRLSATAK